jgi:glucose/arabinose dehydrogenase
MHFLSSLKCAVTALALSLVIATPCAAQLRGQVVVSGLTRPLAFVQDPSNAAVQYVVQQGGLIRTVHNGRLLPGSFLNLSGVISTGGERGLLSLAFPPNYAATGRFFVSFVSTEGNLVVSRFHRSVDPLAADPASRFDLQWSTGNRYISHPFTLHYGGSLVFGGDGTLFIGTGDGGEPLDASHQAQNVASLLGKVLRINVDVNDADPEGFDIPAGNPFAAGGGAPEIWSIGHRNPWKFTIDDPARGGTGALLITDVGEEGFEEVNYEPAGRAGRNYGWRNREGGHERDSSLPPAYGPLIDPTFEYDRSVGRSIIGGYVYRGANNPTMRGRYVFGDFVFGRVWSLALTIDPVSGEARASDFRDHTAEINAAASTRQISSFGVDASGELYAVSWGEGTIVSLSGMRGPAPLLHIDIPYAGTRVRQPFVVAGWALDATAADPGISTLHVWAFPATGAPRFLGVAGYGINRPDVAAYFGPQFQSAGFGITVKGLPPGSWTVNVYGWVNALGGFGVVGSVPVTIDPAGMVVIDVPVNGSEVSSPFILGGWAIDPAAPTGTGIATIHVWAFPQGGGGPVFLGVPNYGDRPDVTALFGAQFYGAGYGLAIGSLPAGTWDVLVFAMSSVSWAFDTVNSVRITVR